MWKSFARSPVTCLIHDRWLCEKPWMNTISGPLGLPQSCAAMVRPSGVLTDTALNFFSGARLPWALAGAQTAASRSAATVMPARRGHEDARVMVRSSLSDFALQILFRARCAWQGDCSVHPADQGCNDERRFSIATARWTLPTILPTLAPSSARSDGGEQAASVATAATVLFAATCCDGTL